MPNPSFRDGVDEHGPDSLLGFGNDSFLFWGRTSKFSLVIILVDYQVGYRLGISKPTFIFLIKKIDN